MIYGHLHKSVKNEPKPSASSAYIWTGRGKTEAYEQIQRENPWRCKCRWWGLVVNLDREQRRGLQLPAYKSPENCRNPGNDPNPNSLSFTRLGSGRVQSRQKFKQDSDDNSGGNERSEPVWRETDDIDSFFGGKPLARCPIGAPTLHTTISWIITQLTPGPVGHQQSKIFVKPGLLSLEEAMSRSARLSSQLNQVLLLALDTRWVNVDQIRAEGGAIGVLIIIWSTPVPPYRLIIIMIIWSSPM